LRFEIAIPIPNNESVARKLFVFSFRSALIFSALSLLGLVLIHFLHTPLNLIYWILTIASVFFLAYIAIGSNWVIRTQEYKRLTASKISNSIVSSTARIVLGYIGWGSIGLIFSSLLGYVANSFFFIKNHRWIKKFENEDSNAHSMSSIVTEYKVYPLVGMPHALIESFRDIVIAYFLIHFFGDQLFGSYGFAMMILGAPVLVLGQSYAQVMTRNLAEVSEDPKELYRRTKKVIKISLLAVIPFGILYFFSEEIFVLIFSERWKEAGLISEVLSLNFLFTFLNAPISSLPLILKKQLLFFIIGLVSTVNMVIMFCYLPAFESKDFDGFMKIITLYSYIQALILIFPILYILFKLKKNATVERG
jgi:O-antigen/teichoic acid export membrane protein